MHHTSFACWSSHLCKANLTTHLLFSRHVYTTAATARRVWQFFEKKNIKVFTAYPLPIPPKHAYLWLTSKTCRVRHEAGEALGAIGSPECMAQLRKHQHDSCLEVLCIYLCMCIARYSTTKPIRVVKAGFPLRWCTFFSCSDPLPEEEVFDTRSVLNNDKLFASPLLKL